MNPIQDEPVRESVLNALAIVHGNLVYELNADAGLTGVYVQGSLINFNGRAFSRTHSDIDLLVTTSLEQIGQRIQFVIKMKEWMQKFENQVRPLLQRTENIPVMGACIATKYELEEGIHKNRNTLHPYDINLFLRLGNEPNEAEREAGIRPPHLHRRKPEAVGKRLSPDLLEGVLFSAWSVMAEAQSFRSHFVTPNDNAIDEPFDNEHISLPKNLLRNAYIYRRLARLQEPAMEIEDDIAKGREEIIHLLNSATAAYDNQAEEILALIETNGPGGRGERDKVPQKHLLYLWELLSLKTQQAITGFRNSSQQKELRFAADDVIIELADMNVYQRKAVGKAISLYEGDLVKEGTVSVKIEPHRQLSLYSFSELDEEKLVLLASEWKDFGIEKYLRDKFYDDKSTNTVGQSDCKVGFAGLFQSQANTGMPEQIAIRPLTYWINQKFNREMIAKSDDETLQTLRKKCMRAFFDTAPDFQSHFPSALYIEVLVITNDNHIPKLVKRPAKSAQAQGSKKPVFTCGIEYGFSWDEHVIIEGDRARLDVRKALMEGLSIELDINESEVKEWSVSDLVVQHAHLNVAILGVVRLNIDKYDLSRKVDRLNALKDQGTFRGMELLTHEDAILAKFKDRNTGDWHQTALRRIDLLDDTED